MHKLQVVDTGSDTAHRVIVPSEIEGKVEPIIHLLATRFVSKNSRWTLKVQVKVERFKIFEKRSEQLSVSPVSHPVLNHFEFHVLGRRKKIKLNKIKFVSKDKLPIIWVNLMNFFHLATCDLARPYFRVIWQMTKTAGDGAPVAPYVMAVKWRKFLFTISDLAERRGEAHTKTSAHLVSGAARFCWIVSCSR